jgi:F-type H+-transporting ATPase subunit epsilon
MRLLHFQLVTPERTVLSKELESLSCPTSLGQITILPNHLPLVANLVPGELVALSSGQKEYINVTGGFVEVKKNNQITVLADAAEHAFEIDEERAKAAVQRAQKAIAEQKMSAEEYAKVATSLERSLSRLNIVRKHSHRRTAPITGEGVFKE